MRQAAQSRPHAFVPARSQGMGPEAGSVPQKQSLKAVVQKAFPSLPIYEGIQNNSTGGRCLLFM